MRIVKRRILSLSLLFGLSCWLGWSQDEDFGLDEPKRGPKAEATTSTDLYEEMLKSKSPDDLTELLGAFREEGTKPLWPRILKKLGAEATAKQAPALAKLIAESAPEEVQAELILILGKIGTEEQAAILARKFQSPNAGVAAAAMTAAARLRYKAGIPELRRLAGDPERGVYAVSALLHLADGAGAGVFIQKYVDKLTGVRIAQNKERAVREVEVLMEAIKTMPFESVPALVSAALDRKQVIEPIALPDEGQAFEQVCPTVCCQKAAENPQAVFPLLLHPDMTVRRIVARFLSAQAPEDLKRQARDKLIVEIGNEDWQHRLLATGVYLYFSTDARPVEERLKDEHWWVRRTAAKALGAWKVRSALPALQKAAQDSDIDVRLAAEEAVLGLQNPR
jgi:HEAT repeat protein